MSKKDLSVLVPEKQDAFNRILRWYTKTDITLTAAEEGILTRWLHADAKFRDGFCNDEIVAEIVEQFSVSKFTAQKDVDNAQQLFARCRQISKKYLLHLHSENINKDLQKIRKDFFLIQMKRPG